MKEWTLDQRIALFDTLMSGLISDEFRTYLVDNGFFTAPASTRFHGSYEGGLFDHSFNVAIALVELTTKHELLWKNPVSPLIVGMFHDLCKIDQYLYNDETKKYIWRGGQKILGHGDKSVKLLLEYIDLNDEERACIEHHMGAFTEKEKWSDFTNAIRLHPNVLYTHMADMISSHITEVKEDE